MDLLTYFTYSLYYDLKKYSLTREISLLYSSKY